MATIPGYRPQPTLDAPSDFNPPALTQAPFKALAEFGATISDLGAHMQARENQKNTFSAEQSWLQFQNRMGEEYVTRQAQIPADGAGWHDTWATYYETERQKFVKSLPTPDLQTAYGAKSQTAATDWSKSSATDQLNQTNKWFRVGIDTAAKDLETKIRQGGGAGFDEFRSSGDKLIQSSSLSPLEKQSLLIKWRSDAAIARIEGIAATDPQAAIDELNAWLKPQKPGPDGKVATGLTQAAMAILRQEEGFAGAAGWDVNAYRAGYGSDTITDANGKVRAVKEGDTVTKADAERDLQRRLPDFINVAAEGVGAGFWKLEPNVQAALVSVAYNYGNIPKSVAAAAQSGDPSKIADAVEALGKNPGINNPQRRSREAAIIRGSSPVNSLADVAPDDLDKVSARVQTMLNQQRAAEDAIAKDGREDVVKFGDDLMRNMPGNPSYNPNKPTLTEDWLASNGGNLTPADRRRYMAALDTTGDETIKTPPQELLRLDDMVASDPRGAIKELRDQFANRLITRGTYDQLLSHAQGILNGEEKRPFIGQIRDYLKQQINPGSDGSSVEYQTALKQLFAYDDWAAGNKTATREDAQRYAADIASNYRKFRVLTLRDTLPIPRFMGVENRLVINPNLIDIAKTRTAAALAAKTISAADAADEANKIKAWESLIADPYYSKPF